MPMGMVLLALFYVLRLPLARMLPASYQGALIPLCQRPRDSLATMIISLLIGAWTHLLLDSFTHTDGGIVQLLPILRSPVMNVAGHAPKVCHLLWYGCSFAGGVWVFLVFEKWKRVNVSGCAAASGAAVARDAALVAIAVIPIEVVHHLVMHRRPGLYLVAVLCALLVIGLIWKLTSVRKDAANQQTVIATKD